MKLYVLVLIGLELDDNYFKSATITGPLFSNAKKNLCIKRPYVGTKVNNLING